MDRTPFIVAVVALALALFALFRQNHAPPRPMPGAPSLLTPDDRRLADLEARVAALESRRPPARDGVEPSWHPPRAPVDIAPQADLGAAPRAPGADTAPPAGSGSTFAPPPAAGAMPPEQLRDEVRRALRDVQDDVMRERFQERQNAREREREARVTKFISDARLTPHQEAEVRDAIKVERDQARTLFDAVRIGDKAFPDAMREMEAVRGTTDEAVLPQLDDTQKEAWRTMRHEDQRAMRRPMFMGGPGGPDGGPAPPPPW